MSTFGLDVIDSIRAINLAIQPTETVIWDPSPNVVFFFRSRLLLIFKYKPYDV